MLTRRAFLRSSTLLSLAPSVPGFLARTARASRAERDGRVLVVVQLDGGNDGINTVVPFADEGYARHRKQLRLPEKELLKIDDRLALHPQMRDAAKLLETGRLAVVPGVGYPNPNRSHFESMAIGSGWSPGCSRRATAHAFTTRSSRATTPIPASSSRTPTSSASSRPRSRRSSTTSRHRSWPIGCSYSASASSAEGSPRTA